MLQKKCDYCGQIFQATTPGWCGCPRCGNHNYVMPQQQPSSINPAVLIALGVGGGILMLLIMSVMICCGTIDSDSDSGDSISGSNRTAASYAAEYYINNTKVRLGIFIIALINKVLINPLFNLICGQTAFSTCKKPFNIFICSFVFHFQLKPHI